MFQVFSSHVARGQHGYETLIFPFDILFGRVKPRGLPHKTRPCQKALQIKDEEWEIEDGVIQGG